MLTKIKKMFVLVMFAAFTFILVGCGGGLKGALEALTVEAEVTEGFVLPTVQLEGAVTVWTSDSEYIVIDETFADVKRPSGTDQQVILTATVTLGEEKVSKEFVVIVKCLAAPNKLNINPGNLTAVEGEEDTYYLVSGKEAELTIDVESEEMSTDVTWSSSSPKRATVSEEGIVKGLDYGVVTITATATAAGEGGVVAKDTIKIEIVEDTNPMKVLLNNKKAIEGQIPRFVSSDFTFPMAPNEDVETLYTLADGTELYYGEYTFVEGVDRQETIFCNLTYKGEETSFEFIISVVTNEEDNEFLALDYATEQLDAIFKPYVGTGKKVAEDIEVPGSFGADVAGYDVVASYTVVTDYQPYPVKVVNVAEEGAEEKLVAQYTKPNDDAAVRVEVYFVTANVNAIVRYNMTAAGYTQAEKVEYLKANVLPQAGEDGTYVAECSHVTLPTADSTGKFGQLAIEWASSDETLITAAGKFANPNLAAESKVTLTATIKYSGTVNSSFAFEEKVAFEYAVKPAANKAQSVALQLSNFIDAPEFMDLIKYFPFGKSDRLDDTGAISNVMPLPRKVGDIATGMDEYADLDITWSVNEEGLLDENFKLLKQYLRYHEVVLTYAVTVDGNTATNEVVINVGITEVKNTIYIGGNYYQQSGGGIHTGDVLSQLSKFDAPVGVLGTASKTWGYSYGNGQFNGYTWYIDETDEVTGAVTRYQYFAHASGFITLDDQYKIELADPADPASVVITLNEELNTLIGSNYGGNWAAIYHNISDKEVKIPLSPYTGGPSPFLDETGAELKWTNHPWKRANMIDRENAFGMDGYRVGFVTDANSVVITGNGETQFQANYDVNNDGKMTDDDFWVTIPAGGYAYTTHTQQNNATVVGRFCHVGTDLHITYFDPYFLSPDGSSEGLGSFVHP